MPSHTPRATVVAALARREAELLGQPPSSGHILVALIWEGCGLAAHALYHAGLPKGADEDIRQRLADAPGSQLGMDAAELPSQAAAIAAGLGHNYIGTEHLLLAVTDDNTLSDRVLAADTRRLASAWLHERLETAGQ